MTCFSLLPIASLIFMWKIGSQGEAQSLFWIAAKADSSTKDTLLPTCHASNGLHYLLSQMK